MSHQARPNFFVIGAAKSGTSAIWNLLRQHPEIHMAKRKEPNFFSSTEIQPFCRGPGDFEHRPLSLDAYHALFDSWDGEPAIGEASTSTLYFPGAVDRLYRYAPQGRIIVLLRQPADRAFSAYMYLRRDGREPERDFAKALRLEDRRYAMRWAFIWHYRRMGRYADQLEPFYRRFGKERIRVYLYDDLATDPLAVLQDMYRLLDVDPAFRPDTTRRMNASGVPRYPFFNRSIATLFDSPNPVRFLARRLVPEDIRLRFTQHMRSRNLVRLSIPQEVRDRLTEHNRESILRLQDLIDRDLSAWLTSSGE
jgi:Sulfotransferase domain